MIQKPYFIFLRSGLLAIFVLAVAFSCFSLSQMAEMDRNGYDDVPDGQSYQSI